MVRKKGFGNRRDAALVAVFLLLCIFLWYLPTGFENRLPQNSLRVRGKVLEVDNSDVKQFGIVRIGVQGLSLTLLDGPFAGRVVEATNTLTGKMELDKVFAPADIVLVVLTLRDGDILYANAQDHYRLHTEAILLGCFALFLIGFGGWTGAKALLSFLFSALMIWKVLVPFFLKGYDPIPVSLGVVMGLTGAIILLVAGVSRRGLTAFLGSVLGIGVTCALALIFSGGFHLHGAIKPFSETLLYSGFAHLDLTRIFLASIFMASSGAVMDIAMDIAASMDEVADKKPNLSFKDALGSGLQVGRAVVGTMTTTLLLAYSGGYVTLLMVFMAQGVPLVNLFNLNYVAAEVLYTLVGSFGLVTVAPFTAVAGAWIYTRRASGESSSGRSMSGR
ncbi:MAG: YibE/F family protein [Thermodesulfobacteriota bacterium]